MFCVFCLSYSKMGGSRSLQVWASEYRFRCNHGSPRSWLIASYFGMIWDKMGIFHPSTWRSKNSGKKSHFASTATTPLLKLSGYSMDLRIRFGVDLILDQWHIGFSKKLQSFYQSWLVVWNMFYFSIYGYGSILINTIFSGMNIHKSQLFWCELQGYKVLTHCHILGMS